MYGPWDMKRDRQNFFIIVDHFCPFTPLTTPKIKIFRKWIKTHGDITILHICIINDNHMMSGFWDVEYHGQNVLLFWIVFYYFIHLTTQKIQILKK